MFRLFLAGSVSASLLSVHAAVFDPLDSQGGKITAKLRSKEDSDCGPFLSSMSVSDRASGQEDPAGEDEPERAFKVSPQAIFAAPCQVEVATDRMSAGPPRLETQ